MRGPVIAERIFGGSLTALYEGREPVQTRWLTVSTPRLPSSPRAWGDYRPLLDYLRHKTEPGTRVACLLTGVAVTGPAGRLPALPAESATWLTTVKPSDEARFARTPRADPRLGGRLVGPEIAPGPSTPSIPQLEAVVHRLYQPEARFGDLAVWRRRP